MLNYIYHILLLKSTYQDINFQSSMNSKFREYSISVYWKTFNIWNFWKNYYTYIFNNLTNLKTDEIYTNFNGIRINLSIANISHPIDL